MSAFEPIVFAVPDTDNLGDNSPQMQAVLGCIATGRPVIVVVGATHRDDQVALAQANALPVYAEQAVHAWLRTEPARRAATRLSHDLWAQGICAPVLDVGEIGPTVRGPVLDATPRSINARAVIQALREHDVVIIPGGCGRTDEGKPAIVGDGSVLLTALFLADRLALELWVLDPDAAPHSHEEKRAITAGTSAAASSAGLRVERRAALFARRQRVPFRVIDASLSEAGVFDPDAHAEQFDQEQIQSQVSRRFDACLTRAG